MNKIFFIIIWIDLFSKVNVKQYQNLTIETLTFMEILHSNFFWRQWSSLDFFCAERRRDAKAVKCN